MCPLCVRSKSEKIGQRGGQSLRLEYSNFFLVFVSNRAAGRLAPVSILSLSIDEDFFISINFKRKKKKTE